MTFPSADQLVERLKRRANLLRFERHGAVPIWFSTQIPADLPIGDQVRHITRDNITLPDNRYWTATNELSGWMTYWWHLGGHCYAATAFILVGPLNTSMPVVEIDLARPPGSTADETDGQCIYGFEAHDFLTYFCKGLLAGLSVPYIYDPVADLKVRILNAISDRIDSTPKAFEYLGEWLMSAVIFEMYKRDMIGASQRGYL